MVRYYSMVKRKLHIGKQYEEQPYTNTIQRLGAATQIEHLNITTPNNKKYKEQTCTNTNIRDYHVRKTSRNTHVGVGGKVGAGN